MKKLFLLIALFMGYELCADTFFERPKYKLYDKSEGLNNNTVSGIFQDREGFLWLGTDIGLTRSDGVNFRHYPFGDKGGSLISDIHQLNDSLLWCWSSNYTTPVCFNIYEGKTLELKGLGLDLMQSLYDFCMVDGKLYAISNSRMLHISMVDEASSFLLGQEELPVGVPVERAFSDSNSLYLLSGNEILVYSPKTGVKERISSHNLGLENLQGVRNLRLFGNYMILYGPEMMPVCYDIKNNRAKFLDTSDPIIDIQQVSGNCFILATWNTISVLEFSGEDLIGSSYAIEGLFDGMAPYAAIFRNRISEMYYDKRNEVLWVGITGRGMMQISFRGDRVKRIEVPAKVRMVNGMAQDRDGYIWLSTNTQGVFRSSGNTLSHKMHFESAAGMEKGKYVMFQDNFDYLWFGDSKGNITRLNPQNNRKEQIDAQYLKDGRTVAPEKINALCLNSRNRLWIAAENGLFVYDASDGAVLAHMPIGSETGRITAICQDGGGNMWIGTEKGVCQAQRSGDAIILTNGFEEKANVAATKVLALYVNNFNQLYASYEDKTIHIDASTKEIVETLMLRRDYSSGHIACITDDGSGCTWLGTAGGVVMVNNETLESYLYELPESYMQVEKLRDGELLWATSNGLVYFLPDNIKNWVSNRELIVSGLEINYRTLGDDAPYNFDGPLQFKRRENNLHVYISDLRFGASSSKIEYRLLPADKEWRSTYGNYVELRDLKPGKYVLEMRNPNITGAQPPVTHMDFIIKRSWIFSFWGILTLVGGVLALMTLGQIFMLLRFRKKKKLSAIESRLLGKINESIEREERAKLRGTLRHEIVQNLRTPISLIIAPLREISSDSSVAGDVKVKSNIALLNSVIVQEICTRLEDLFLLEKDEIYKVAPYEVSKISNSTVFPLKEVFNTSRVKVYFNKDNSVEKVLWVDLVRISFLLRSLLVHVMQYLEYTGEMRLELKEGEWNGRKACIFVIKTKRIARIQKDRSLSLCRDYEEAINQKLLGWQFLQYVATIHEADVYFKESVAEGMEVTLYLPFLSKEDWSNKANVEIIEPIEEESVKHAFDNLLSEGSSLDLDMDEPEDEPEDVQEGMAKLLVIEDNPDIRLYMKVMFSKQYNMLLAENGEQGIEMARTEKPNLILTDVMMPGIDGYEVLRIVKEEPATCHIPVVLLTALTSEDDIIKGFDLGADDYITKPFNPEILRAKIRQLVKGRRELKQIYTDRLTSAGVSLGEQEEAIKEEDPLIVKINELVIANIKNPDFNVKELASMLFMSQPTLYRKVKQITGYTIIEVVRTVRLRQAAELLKTRKYGIQEVSELVGYNDVPTFRKHFIALYGTTPSSYMSSNDARS
ncbi:MAG: response regulator [Bacteroidales bacterium]|nr:response regulator [Bacteroidales bacterium]